MKKIKSLLLLLLVGFVTISLTACGEKNVEGSLEEIMTKVYADLNDDEKPMMLGNIEVNEEMDNVESFIGTKEIEYEEILASESMVGSIAHSVVLVRMKDGADIESAKSKIKETVNPRKWICVGVEKEDVIVKNKGNLIILIMVENETTRNKLEQGFDNL
ncbi:MAG: hypothetical protein IJE89_02675 [Bacilli bacterium]|nr:hypothetical protein [Bacilli bacterium]